MRIRPQGHLFAQVFPSLGDSRNPDAQQRWSPENPAKAEQSLLGEKGKNLS